jgi:hypothetical protein
LVEHNQKETTMAKSPKPPLDRKAGNKRPVHTLRHRRLKAVIWRNETERGPMFNVVIVRSYRDANEEWQDTHSIGYDDLMNVAALMYEAHAFISSVISQAPKPAAAKNRGE